MRRPRPSKKLTATAYHEAGHAIVHVRLGLPLKAATIVLNPEHETLGSATSGAKPKTVEPEWDTSKRTVTWLEKHIIAFLAGPAAEMRFTGRANHVGASRDYHDAVRYASFIHSDREALSAYLRLQGIIAKLYVTSPRWWPAIEAVAAALLKRRTLSGRAVRAIVRGVLSCAPPGPGETPRCKIVSRSCRRLTLRACLVCGPSGCTSSLSHVYTSRRGRCAGGRA